jgi:hypothetical protein
MSETLGDVRHAIENLLYTYARLADDLDAEGIGILMARASVISHGSTSTGHDEVVARLAPLFAEAEKSRHLMSNILVTLGSDGTTASATLYYDKWEIHDEPVVMASGRYASEFARDDDGWYFTSHHVQNAWRRAVST